jgi:hypothetical protein
LGVQRGALDKVALQIATPSRIEKNAAKKHLDRLKAQHGERWLDIGQQMTFTLPGRPQPATLDELLAMEGAQAPVGGLKAPTRPTTPRAFQSKEVLVNGRRAFANFNPDDGKFYDQSGAEVSGATPIPPQSAAQAPGSLPPRVQQQVNSVARSWDSLPVVKTTQKMAEAVSFAEALNPNTTNPADDQALIYSFAKAMDPDSVVREGEYATVQKYAQSWAQSFGFNAARIFSNTPFLTPQARQNMKSTIRARYKAGLGQYANVRRSYVQKINKMTGLGDGDDYLTDYAGGFPAEDTPYMGEPHQGPPPAQTRPDDPLGIRR